MVNFFKKLMGRQGEQEQVELHVQGNPTNIDQSNEITEENIFEEDTITKGEVTIHSTSVSPANGSLVVGFFISNGLSKKIKFEKLPLVLMDADKKILARQTFEAEVVGEVAPQTEKACVVRFDQKSILATEIPQDCQAFFDLPKKRPENPAFEFQALPVNITETQKQELEHVLAGLPPLKDGEVNFSPLQAQVTPDQNLLATVIIRNSSDKVVNLQQLPLAFYDATREELVRGQFNIEELKIQPKKAMMWSFNFGPVSPEKEIDLSKWYINVAK